MLKPSTLTKVSIIESVLETNSYTLKKAFETVEISRELIKRSLESGQDVLTSCFGKFCLKKKTKRRGRNPATDKDMMFAPRGIGGLRALEGQQRFRPKISVASYSVDPLQAWTICFNLLYSRRSA